MKAQEAYLRQLDRYFISTFLFIISEFSSENRPSVHIRREDFSFSPFLSLIAFIWQLRRIIPIAIEIQIQSGDLFFHFIIYFSSPKGGR